MKNLTPIFLALFLMYSPLANSQNVGVGTTTPEASALLDIEDANKGLLIPRVSLTDVSDGVSPINAPATSLLVYNTNAAVTGGKGAGYYYWNGSSWVNMQEGIVNDWHEVGSMAVPDDINDDIFTQGDVGIGTVAPAGRLHVKLPNTQDNALKVTRGVSDIFDILSTGQMGLGTGINAGSPYDIVFGLQSINSTSNDMYYVAASGAAPIRQIFGNATANFGTFEYHNSINAPNKKFFFTVNSSPDTLLSLTGNGYVGIGTPNPTRKLHVKSSVNANLVRLEDDDKTWYHGIAIGNQWGIWEDTPASADNRFIVLPGGNVGVNTTAPMEKFHVDGVAAFGTNLPYGVNLGYYNSGNYARYNFHALLPSTYSNFGGFIEGGNVGQLMIGLRDNQGTDGVYFASGSGNWNADNIYDRIVMAIQAQGFVGVNTVAPTANLSVNGTANKPGGGAWAVFSDKRSKENIKDYRKGLTELLKINPVSFNYKKEFGWGSDTHVGLIAQEIEQVVPTMVTEKEVQKLKDFKEVDPNELTYILINSIQEQQIIIENQQAEIEKLKQDNQAINTASANGVQQMERVLEQLELLQSEVADLKEQDGDLGTDFSTQRR